MRQLPPRYVRALRSPSFQRWALLLLAVATAAFLRLWQLNNYPPGLYRDEAYNGLDALGVLDGHRPLFFAANNGREPLYIYLTALSIALFGRSLFAVRLTAALIGTATTLATYGLARQWFGWRVGLLSAWLWAITLWPIHLSRVGLRVILLVPLLALTFWLATIAYQRHSRWWAIGAGVCYGVAFYTYLAVRFTPVLLVALAVYWLIFQRRGAQAQRKKVVFVMGWMAVGTAVATLPLALHFLQNPDLILGRTGQVSILSHAVNGGDLWGTVAHHIGQALGLFVWQGDMILRHNPAGRPLFDIFIALPFLVGLLICLRDWRRPFAALLLLWIGVMLGPTILAADPPHFLRAVGILPAALILPAIGLERLWRWGRAPRWGRQTAVLLLLVGSLTLTIRDYVNYSRSPDTGYLFEQGVTSLALQMNATATETAVYADNRWWSWPTIPFLLQREVIRYDPAEGLPQPTAVAAVYAWPYDTLDFIPRAIIPPAEVTVTVGDLARGDLEPTPYPLFVRYEWRPVPLATDAPALFGEQWGLQNALAHAEGATVVVDLTWTAVSSPPPPAQPILFVHIVGAEGLLAQMDAPIGQGYWGHDWWTADVAVRERRTLHLPIPFDPAEHEIRVGLYDAITQERIVGSWDHRIIGSSDYLVIPLSDNPIIR